MNSVNLKILTVNQCWQGRRFKTPAHTKYRSQLHIALPDGVIVPDCDLEVTYNFRVSNKRSDYDNLIKSFQDALCSKYGFDDSQIYKATITKEIVKKGEEGADFEIRPLHLECKSCWDHYHSQECLGEHAAEAGYG